MGSFSKPSKLRMGRKRLNPSNWDRILRRWGAVYRYRSGWLLSEPYRIVGISRGWSGGGFRCFKTFAKTNYRENIKAKVSERYSDLGRILAQYRNIFKSRRMEPSQTNGRRNFSDKGRKKFRIRRAYISLAITIDVWKACRRGANSHVLNVKILPTLGTISQIT